MEGGIERRWRRGGGGNGGRGGAEVAESGGGEAAVEDGCEVEGRPWRWKGKRHG